MVMLLFKTNHDINKKTSPSVLPTARFCFKLAWKDRNNPLFLREKPPILNKAVQIPVQSPKSTCKRSSTHGQI